MLFIEKAFPFHTKLVWSYSAFIYVLICSDTLEQSIKKYAAKILVPSGDNRFVLTVRRRHALTDGLELMEFATPEQLFSPLNVLFIGESAVDDGGPGREFASLMVMQCPDSHLMEGKIQ